MKNRVPYVISGDFNTTKALGVMSPLLREHIDAVHYSRFNSLTFEYLGLKPGDLTMFYLKHTGHASCLFLRT